MPKFTVKIDCENVAFQPWPELEIARILAELSENIRENGLTGFYQNVKDINGNIVGQYALKNDDGSNYSKA